MKTYIERKLHRSYEDIQRFMILPMLLYIKAGADRIELRRSLTEGKTYGFAGGELIETDVYVRRGIMTIFSNGLCLL